MAHEDEKNVSPLCPVAAQVEVNPLLALAGTWTFGEADEYVRKLREEWEIVE